MNLPISLTSAIRQRITSSDLLSQQYFNRIEETKQKQKNLGIALNSTNQTIPQTEELLKHFSGQGCLSYPQWKHESYEVLRSSGISKAHWYSLLLKKIVARSYFL